MLKSSVLKNTSQKSPLSSMQTIGSSGKNSGKNHSSLAVALPLTSLIDAFSIIVIYLLIGTQSATVEPKISGQIQLPVAEAGLQLSEEMPIVRIENGAYFIEDEQVSVSQLVQKLAELKQKLQKEDVQIMIQADQKMNYADLDPLLRAGSAAGIQKLKFAVTPTK
jgi:biopolymer transport protein ExbD